MYKNLGAAGLGISGRQSELIELALTYGFRGFDVVMERLVKQSQRNSLEHAGRFIDSAANFANGFAIGGWDPEIRWDADDAAFKERANHFNMVTVRINKPKTVVGIDANNPHRLDLQPCFLTHLANRSLCH